MAKTDPIEKQEENRKAEYIRLACNKCFKNPCGCPPQKKKGSGSGGDDPQKTGVDQDIDSSVATTTNRRTPTPTPSVTKVVHLLFFAKHAIKQINRIAQQRQTLEPTAEQEFLETEAAPEKIKALFDAYMQRLMQLDKNFTGRGWNITIDKESGVLTITMPNTAKEDKERRENFLTQLSLLGIQFIRHANKEPGKELSSSHPMVQALERIKNPANTREKS